MRSVADPVLQLRGVSVEIAGRELVSDVSFEIARGELVALIGPNGSGKTTLLRAILGEYRHKGEVTVNGRIGYVPQRLAYDRALPMTVLEFMALNVQRRPLVFGVSRDSRKRTLDLLARVGARKLAHSALGGLSGGELQRVLLAGALEGDPDLLLLDEPAAGVDIEGEQTFLDLIKREVKDRGCAVVLVSHDLSVVSDITDRVLCLNRTLMCQGKAEDLLTAETIARVFGGGHAIYDHHRAGPHGKHDHDHGHQH